MKTWLEELWTNKDAFKAALRSAGKWCAVILGGLVTTGVIPSDGFGKYLGPFLVAIGAGFPTQPLRNASTPEVLGLLSQKLAVVDRNVKKVANQADVSLVATDVIK